ncbi:PAS domain-containing sensor histidine kinase [Fundidesulfovibrio terrae]|uniref:PAS domain-containing sensor histidine kinase n=1 Tax=Fundidesulfovibrio terrae TaxID=2922866 RepID=UPI001FAEAF2C|nr:PAS domain-containing sensor histidine kinase [Fundidesulfovibrio terrae]
MTLSKAAKVSAAYAAAGACWILFSDAAADALFSARPELLAWVQTIKGWVFISVTALLLYGAFRRHDHKTRTQLSALEESEARYRTVIENISDVYYQTDKDGRLVMVSPSALAVLGYDSLDEMQGRPNESFWNKPAEREQFMKLIEKNGSVRDFEVVLKRKDGSPVVVSTSSGYHRDAQGNILGVEGIFRDITERKNAEKALRENEGRLRVIFETSPSAIFQVDHGGTVVLANNRTSELFGYPPGGVLGKQYSELVHPDQRAQGGENMRRLLTGELDHVTLERRYIRADGSEFWGHLSGQRLEAQDGTFLGLVGIIADISEHKRVEAQLESSHRLITNIIDSLPAAVIGADGLGRITHFNRKAQDFFGKRSLEVSGLDILEVLPRLPVRREELEAVRAGNRTLKLEKIPLPSTEGLRLADVLVYPLEAPGPGHVVLIIEDVTERVRLEGIMVQTEKMMSVGGLAAGMAHEINNPLGGIVQGVQVILRRLDPLPKVNQEAAAKAGIDFKAMLDYLNRREIIPLIAGVRESAVRAAHIVASMLDFSRKGESLQAPTDLSVLLDKSVELSSTDYDLKKKYDFRKIEIVTDYDPDLPLVPCAATQIEQVFLNLLRNAAQAMRGRGKDGPPPRITLRTRREGSMARVEVEDNGPGIPEDVCHRVFEPFFSTKPPGEGTGLGLSVSYFIVTSNHKGTIQVESKPGQGSTFTIRLPLTPPQSA